VLRERKPDVILVSMAAFGKSGPDWDFVGFGPVIELMSGACSLSGYLDDEEPFKTGISYGDPVAGVWAAGAVAMALINRRRTGEGTFVDLSQREGLSAMIGEEFVRAAMTGEPPAHRGVRSERWAPQGVYRVAGDDQWLALSVTDDAEWVALCGWLGRDELASLSLDERRARHDELDGLIGAALAARDPQDTMESLQSAGVPAGRVLNTGDIHDDVQLQRRGFWQYLPHPAMIRYKQAGIAWQLTDLKPRSRRHAPLFDEHTREILLEVCGYSEAEIAELYEAGVCATAPVNPGHG
jgi:benzylsuccinate CoA-transferase BbsF subunit